MSVGQRVKWDNHGCPQTGVIIGMTSDGRARVRPHGCSSDQFDVYLESYELLPPEPFVTLEWLDADTCAITFSEGLRARVGVRLASRAVARRTAEGWQIEFEITDVYRAGRGMNMGDWYTRPATQRGQIADLDELQRDPIAAIAQIRWQVSQQ